VKRIDILEQPDDVRTLVAECELTGRRTLFERQGRPVAALISYDEYMALRETIDIANDADLRAAIERGDDEARRGAVCLVEELVEGMRDEG
jgi:PHD/YefM family antitoxin component YafN of YafNO toxin-antitoxin module